MEKSLKNLVKSLGKILSNENLEAIYNRFDPLREDVSKDPAFLDELATVKNPLQNIVHLKDNDVRFRSVWKYFSCTTRNFRSLI